MWLHLYPNDTVRALITSHLPFEPVRRVFRLGEFRGGTTTHTPCLFVIESNGSFAVPPPARPRSTADRKSNIIVGEKFLPPNSRVPSTRNIKDAWRPGHLTAPWPIVPDRQICRCLRAPPTTCHQMTLSALWIRSTATSMTFLPTCRSTQVCTKNNFSCTPLFLYHHHQHGRPPPRRRSTVHMNQPPPTQRGNECQS